MIKTFSLFDRYDKTDKIQITFDEDKIYLISKDGCKLLNIHLKETDIKNSAWRIHYGPEETSFFGTFINRENVMEAKESAGLMIGDKLYICPTREKRMAFSSLCVLIYVDLWYKLNNV